MGLDPSGHSGIIGTMNSETKMYSKDVYELAHQARAKNSKKWVAEKFRSTLEDYNHCCAVCGEHNPFALQLDHVEPTSKGGEDTPENWQVLCGPCNNVKNNIHGMARIPARQPSTNDQDKVAAHVAFRIACQALREEQK